MGAVFIKILNMSLTAGLIVLVVLLVRLLLKNKAPKALFPVLWAMVAVRLVCPVTFESSFSLIRNTEPVEHVELPKEFTQKETVHTPSEKNPLPEGVEAVELPEELPPGVEVVIIDTPEIGKGLSDVFEGLDEKENPGTEAIGSTDNSGNQGTEGKAEITINETPFSVTYTETKGDGTAYSVKRTDYSAVKAVLWLCGIGIMLLYTAISYLRIYRQVRESAPLGENVRVCDRIDSPFILGIIRPRIYLPSDINAADRVFVLAHERAHLKRFDHIWKPIGFLLLSVYWFHPLLWVAYILLCKDIEYACDEKVIKELGAEQKKTYSTALINCSVSRKMISACPLAFGETGVKGRVKSVLHYKKPAFWVLVASVLVCVVMAVCFLTNPKDKEETPKVTPGVTETPDLTSVPDKIEENENESPQDKGQIAYDLTKQIENTNISIAIGDEYAAYLDENGKLHVLYDTSLIWEHDPIGATRGIDLTKTYKALGTDPWRLVAIDDDGRPYTSYYMTTDEITESVKKTVEETMAAGGNYGTGGPQPWIAKDFEEMSGVKQIYSKYPYNSYTALFENGTVYHYGIRDDFSDIVQIAKADGGVIVGIKEDGTFVVPEMSDLLRKKQFDEWPKKLKQVCAEGNFIVGLREDGTVITESVILEYLINTIEKWSDIVKIAAAGQTIIGLKADGTVVAVCPPTNDKGQCEVDDWTDVIAVNTNGKVTVGITKDGKVLMAGDVPEIVKALPERYNYEEIKSIFLEYLNHQAWLYPAQYPQESYTCAYELYRSVNKDKTYVHLKTIINENEHWFSFEPKYYYVPESPIHIVEQRTEDMRASVERGDIVSFGSNELYIPAATKPVYGNREDYFKEDISSIYSDLKRNGYRDNLKIEAIVSDFDMEKNLYPYVYLIINDSEVFETSFKEIDVEPLQKMFFYGNYTKDYTINYSDGWPDVFDGHGIKPIDSVNPEQFERIKACATFHKVFVEEKTETVLINGEAVELGSPNLAINEAFGVGIAFLPQWAMASSVHYNIYRSDDSGKSWRMIAEDFSVVEGDIARILIPEKDTVVCYFEISGTTSQSSCFVSEDGGITWEHATYPSKPNNFSYDPQKDRSVIFGAYEQDGDYSNGKEPLEWIVLDRDGNRALLLSKYGIETLRWDKDKTLEVWEVDDLYRMMNRTIYEYAFTAEERAALIKTNPIENESVHFTNEMLLYPGYTFLLDTDDVLYGKGQDGTLYFRTEESRITIPTAYAAQKGAWLDKNGDFAGAETPWLLTVTGTTNSDFSEVQFARVFPDGSISYEEEEIKEQHVLIRPAIWVDVTKIPK